MHDSSSLSKNTNLASLSTKSSLKTYKSMNSKAFEYMMQVRLETSLLFLTNFIAESSVV